MTDSLLLDETFRITGVNSQKYDRVSRLTGTHDDLSFTLDVAHELFTCTEDDTVQLVLASTLNLDGSKDDEGEWRDISGAGPSRGGMGGTGIGAPTVPGQHGQTAGWAQYDSGEGSLADGFDYVCYGKVYRFEEGGENIKVYASFGGLLLYIEGPHKRLSNLRIDNVYLLMKK